MKEFLKFTLASILGVFISFAIFFVAFLIFIIIIIASFQTQKIEKIPSNSVLEIQLNYVVPERSYQSFSAITSFPFVSARKQIGLPELIDNIKKAKSDHRVKGLYLNLDNFICGGIATVEAVRNELVDFKKSGKFIIAYGDYISQKAYYMATTADKIYIEPDGFLDFRGFSIETMFFKNTLDKLEIEPQIFQAGEYKSATEPFRLDKMSEANRKQITSLLTSINIHMLKEIESTRKISYDSLKLIADNFLIHFPEDAEKYRFVNSLFYRDQVVNEMKIMAGTPGKRKLNLTSIEDYTNVKAKDNSSSRNRIAVIYALGDIQHSSGSENIIGYENLPEAIRKAKDDERVKAIVMRVNSPGGDALTSDLIWREVTLAKKEKPFIISMGNVAASGGYYISCAADTIVAEPNTITGSIGVFGILPNLKNFFKDKLGITFDRVNTGKFSDLFDITRPLTNEEKVIFQSAIDKIYRSFVEKVAGGRKKTFDYISNIAQGRVWTGLQAKENGLVDEIGGLNDAIKIAAAKAKIKQYSLVEYPAQKNLIRTILEDFSADAELSVLKMKLGENFVFYNQLQKYKNLKGIQARLPVDFTIY